MSGGARRWLRYSGNEWFLGADPQADPDHAVVVAVDSVDFGVVDQISPWLDGGAGALDPDELTV